MKTLKIIGILILLFIGVTGELIKNIETIPDNAQIDVFPTQRQWVPHQSASSKYFNLDRPGANRIKLLEMLSNITPAVYYDVNQGKFKGYTLIEDFGKKSDFTVGYNQSQLWTWIFGKKSRWNEDGSWNY